MTTPFLAADITHDEGKRLRAYQDTKGIWTIGVGHAYVKPGTVWTEAQCAHQLALDIEEAKRNLDKHLPWWRGLNSARQDVLVNMSFNLGIFRLLGFKNTLEAIRTGQWAKAYAGMLSSLWAAQVKGRATRLAQQMLLGVRVAPS